MRTFCQWDNQSASRIFTLTSFGREASGTYNEPSLGNSSILSLDGPFTFVLVELGADDNSLKSTVFAELKDLIGVIEVCLKFIPARVVCCPVPILVDFWNGQLIDRDRAIDPSTWIDILEWVRYRPQKEMSTCRLTQRQVPPKPWPASYSTVLKPCFLHSYNEYAPPKPAPITSTSRSRLSAYGPSVRRLLPYCHRSVLRMRSGCGSPILPILFRCQW